MPISKLKRLMCAERPKHLTCYTGVEEAAAADAAATAASSTVADGAVLLPAATAAPSFSAAAPGLFAGISPGALALQGGGALAQMYAQQQAASRKQSIADALKSYQMNNAGQQTGIVNNYVAGDTPAARAADLTTATNQAKQGLDSSVGAAQAFATPNAVAGNVSQQFKDAGQASADAAMTRNNALIANMAAMRAPGLAGEQRSRDYGLAASEIGGLKSAASSVGAAGNTDINGVVPDPWLTLAGQAAAGVGQGIQQSATTNAANAKTIAAMKAMRGGLT